ncbi:MULTISPECIES: hypothetical protein [Flavobacterium]|uniref:XRE family transcriptional regulator n=1 Tax=Flavobacterium endoglycinae TaxID=2816357 RepID=A0ABX7Q909_9FLAO|nr:MULTISPECIES: hypothetical protein [Flavobacterium]QSW87164.1 hypothetical protein J0383_12740 [Flavobacterium endoglycinae]
MSSILKSIQQIAINEGIGITKLEQTIGASKGVLSRAIARNSDIQAKWILKIIENYPQYNCEWLIKNEGPMIRKNNTTESDTIISEQNINYKELAEARKETIESMKKEILYLEEKIASK